MANEMGEEREKDITSQLLRSRFDAYLLQGQRAEAYRIIDLAWQMGHKYLAAQMALAMEAYDNKQP